MSKYRNVKTTLYGIAFDSKREAGRYAELRMLEQGGAISDLKTQVPYELVVNGVKVCKYIADFVYTVRNPSRTAGGPFVLDVVEDVKGMRAGAAYQTFKLKAKLMKAVLGIEVVEI